MSTVYTPEELRVSLETPADINSSFQGRKLIKLAPNTTFELDKPIWIRKKIILDGQGSRIVMKSSGSCLIIGEDYSKPDAFRNPRYDSTFSTIRNLDLVRGDSSTQSGMTGILCRCHGLRLENIRFLHWETGVQVEGHASISNSNNTSLRDLYFFDCDTALRFTGVDASVATVDHCEIISCNTGIELLNISYSVISNLYTEGTKIPIKSGHNYATWVGCGSENAHLTKDFIGGTVLGGNLVSGARKINALGDRIGRGDSRIQFTMTKPNNSKEGVRVFIPGNFEGTPSPLQFIQIENEFPNDPDRRNNVRHGIVYVENENSNPQDIQRKYILGTQSWKIEPNGCEWDVV